MNVSILAVWIGVMSVPRYTQEVESNFIYICLKTHDVIRRSMGGVCVRAVYDMLVQNVQNIVYWRCSYG